MGNLWTYRESFKFEGDASHLIGYDVEATDGHIGKIDEASQETDSGHLVVDTGFWIFGKKRLIPAGVATRVDDRDKKVYISMTKDQVKDAPDWHANWRSDTKSQRPYDEYYGPYGW